MRFLLVYVAAFLAFLSQFIRDFSVLNYSEMVSPATVSSYIYIYNTKRASFHFKCCVV